LESIKSDNGEYHPVGLSPILGNGPKVNMLSMGGVEQLPFLAKGDNLAVARKTLVLTIVSEQINTRIIRSAERA
jgi:hypothetical protein